MKLFCRYGEKRLERALDEIIIKLFDAYFTKNLELGNDSAALVGDSIFLNSFGRTDFPCGDELTLYKNLKSRLLTLPDETVLLTGHSEPSTVGNEKNRSWFK